MRAGLLTRFMGALGMVAAALQIIQYGAGIPLVLAFWLGGLAVLYLGQPPRRRPARLAHRPRGAVAVRSRAGRGPPGRAGRQGPARAGGTARERVPAGAHPATSKRKRKRRS